MIKIPTVFIVGAGASKPYGFPIGRELVTLICNNLINDQSRYFKQLNNNFTLWSLPQPST